MSLLSAPSFWRTFVTSALSPAAKEEGAQPSLEEAEASGAAQSAGTPGTLRTSCPALTSQAGPVPKPLGSDVIIDTQSKRPKRPSAKAVQIIAPRPLASRKAHGHLSGAAAVLTCHLSSDHDYCRPPHGRATNLRDVCPDPDSRHGASTWNLRATDSSSDSPEAHLPGRPETGSHSPTVRAPSGSEETMALWPLPTPPPSPPSRGRDGRRCRRRAHSGSSSGSSSSWSPSPSRSPERQRQGLHMCEGWMCWCCSAHDSSCPAGIGVNVLAAVPLHALHRDATGALAPEAEATGPGPHPGPGLAHQQPGSSVLEEVPGELRPAVSCCGACSCSCLSFLCRTCGRLRSERESRMQKLKAIVSQQSCSLGLWGHTGFEGHCCDCVVQDERRVVYVGRICGSMTHDELRERFLQFGQVECVSLHFRETGSVCSAALFTLLAER